MVNNRASNELGEVDDKERVVEEVLVGNLAAVPINLVRYLLECEEGNANWEDDLSHGHVCHVERARSVYKEYEIFEVGEQC